MGRSALEISSRAPDFDPEADARSVIHQAKAAVIYHVQIIDVSESDVPRNMQLRYLGSLPHNGGRLRDNGFDDDLALTHSGYLCALGLDRRDRWLFPEREPLEHIDTESAESSNTHQAHIDSKRERHVGRVDDYRSRDQTIGPNSLADQDEVATNEQAQDDMHKILAG